MFDKDSTSDINAEEASVFRCEHCPGKVFTSADKDNHQQWHLDQRQCQKNDSKEIPTTSTESSRSSVVKTQTWTKFEINGFSFLVTSDSANESSDDDNESHGQVSPNDEFAGVASSSQMISESETTDRLASPARKRPKSRKVYDDSIVGNWSEGNGAGPGAYRGPLPYKGPNQCKSVPSRRATPGPKPIPSHGSVNSAKPVSTNIQNLNEGPAAGSSSCRIKDLEGRRATKCGYWLPPDDETWMAFAPGFNVEGECENPQCVSRTSNELPILRRGYGNSCLRKELSVCPACNQRTLKAGTVLVSEARCLFNFKKTGVSTGDSTLMEHLGSFPSYVTPDEGNDEVDYDIIEITTVKPTESPFICRWCDTAIGTKANEVRKACGHDFHKNCCSSNCPICSADLIAE